MFPICFQHVPQGCMDETVRRDVNVVTVRNVIRPPDSVFVLQDGKGRDVTCVCKLYFLPNT